MHRSFGILRAVTVSSRISAATSLIRQKTEALGLSWATGLEPLVMIEYPYLLQ